LTFRRWSALTSARGRIRAVGQAKPDAPYPPLRIQLGAAGPAADVTANVKGTAAVLTGPAVQAGPATLLLTSHAPAAVTVKDIDVISTS